MEPERTRGQAREALPRLIDATSVTPQRILRIEMKGNPGRKRDERNERRKMAAGDFLRKNGEPHFRDLEPARRMAAAA